MKSGIKKLVFAVLIFLSLILFTACDDSNVEDKNNDGNKVGDNKDAEDINEDEDLLDFYFAVKDKSLYYGKDLNLKIIHEFEDSSQYEYIRTKCVTYTMGKILNCLPMAILFNSEYSQIDALDIVNKIRDYSYWVDYSKSYKHLILDSGLLLDIDEGNDVINNNEVELNSIREIVHDYMQQQGYGHTRISSYDVDLTNFILKGDDEVDLFYNSINNEVFALPDNYSFQRLYDKENLDLIIAVKRDSGFVLYNTVTKEKFEKTNVVDVSYYWPGYHVSYLDNGKLFLYDIDKREETLIYEAGSNDYFDYTYSVSQDIIHIQTNDKIIFYSIENNQVLKEIPYILGQDYRFNFIGNQLVYLQSDYVEWTNLEDGTVVKHNIGWNDFSGNESVILADDFVFFVDNNKILDKNNGNITSVASANNGVVFGYLINPETLYVAYMEGNVYLLENDELTKIDVVFEDN